ncbi:MAG: hypothetical protein R3C56_03940 [Pirellulaceae bacterium]
MQGTTPLTMEGDIAARLVEGVDRFLLQEIERSIALREQHFQRDFTSPVVYQRSLKPNRERLAHILGVRDERPAFDALEFVSSTSESHLVATGDGYKVYAVRWPAAP